MRALLSIAVAAAAVYVVLVLIVYFAQSRLIYFPNVPGRELGATPADIGLGFEEVTLAAADGVRIHGWLVAGPRPDAPVVLFCHGNAGNISHRLDWLAILNELGFAVLLFDYRGYGRSDGAPDEAGTYLDAQAAWTFLTRERAIPPERIVVFGESLGGAIAAHLAAQSRPAALILSSAFTSVPDLAARYYWYLPVRLLSRFDYGTAGHVARVAAPVLVMHSRDDEIVPFEHGLRLFERAGARKRFVELTGDHNGGFLVSGRALTDGLRAFLAEHQLLTG
jgi:uncharacterized protein